MGARSLRGNRTAHGFGLRAVSGDATGYAHSSDLSVPAIRRAGAVVQAIRAGHQGTLAEPPAPTNRSLYTDENPLGENPFESKVKLLAEIDAYARRKDSRVKQVSASLSGEWQAVQILRRRMAVESSVGRLSLTCVSSFPQ